MVLIEEPPLFAEPVVQSNAAPRCRMCSRSARWIPTQRRYGAYCSGTHCSNRHRICQECGSTFEMNTGEAGTKYCSTVCKIGGYNPASRRVRLACAWCGGPCSNPSRRAATRSVWPYICAGCLDPIKHVVDRLKAHRVPHERARQLRDAPNCEVCGTDLLARMRAGNGKVRAALVVDHDHDCCPVDSHSCGQCVRGFLCGQCNSAAGLLRDSPDSARQLAKYLETWSSRTIVAAALADETPHQPMPGYDPEEVTR